MTKDEALRLALEALGSGIKTQFGRLDWIEYDIELVEQAITAIKAALEAPQRTWVGLTNEDEIDWQEGGNLKDLVKAIEAKLKAKNS
jgi:cytosine/adenosine deaminase-related metal-dependent hydrolase